MATTIELDIIKKRSDKLAPEEKYELIDYLKASLASEEAGQHPSRSDKNSSNITNSTNDGSKIS